MLACKDLCNRSRRLHPGGHTDMIKPVRKLLEGITASAAVGEVHWRISGESSLPSWARWCLWYHIRLRSPCLCRRPGETQPAGLLPGPAVPGEERQVPGPEERQERCFLWIRAGKDALPRRWSTPEPPLSCKNYKKEKSNCNLSHNVNALTSHHTSTVSHRNMISRPQLQIDHSAHTGDG